MIAWAFAFSLLLIAGASDDFGSQFGEGKKWEDCLSYAVEAIPFDTAPFTQGSRAIPDLNSSISLTRWGWERGTASKACFEYQEKGCSPGKMKIRYKIINRVVYASEVDYRELGFTFGRKGATVHWVHAQLAETIEEMLVFSVWLYKDWPDMEVAFTVSSGPGKVNATFDPNEKGNLINVPRLGFATFGHSYSIPHQKNWNDFAMSEAQLYKYTECLQKRFPSSLKIPVVFFRGSPTGYKRGWSNETRFNETNFADRLVANQRTWIALTSRNHPFMDVKLTRVNKLFNNQDPKIRADFHQMLTRPGLPQEEWSKHAFILSINGHGYTDRVPSILLSGSLPVLPDAQMKEWMLMDPERSKMAFQDVLWYEEDASDLLHIAKKAVSKWISGGAGREELQARVNRTQALAVGRFHCLAVLDAFTWSVNHLWKNWCGWKVDLPPSGWRPIKLSTPFRNPYIPQDIWAKVKEGMKTNFP